MSTTTIQLSGNTSSETWTEASADRSDREIGIAEGAAMLHVSRDFFINLLRDGSIPSRKVSGQFQVLLTDVRNYRAALRVRQEEIMERLAAESRAAEGE